MGTIASRTLSRLSREFLETGATITTEQLAPSVLAPYATKSALQSVILSLEPVATSGAYSDLTGKPDLFSGAYSDLTGKPSIPSAPGDIGAATAAQGANADTAFGWGDHAIAGYLPAFAVPIAAHVVTFTGTLDTDGAGAVAGTVTLEYDTEGRLISAGVAP
jgi:hypothetical protein